MLLALGAHDLLVVCRVIKALSRDTLIRAIGLMLAASGISLIVRALALA